MHDHTPNQNNNFIVHIKKRCSQFFVTVHMILTIMFVSRDDDKGGYGEMYPYATLSTDLTD